MRFVQPLSFGIRVLPDQKWWRVKRVFIGLFDGMECPKSFEWTMEGLWIDRAGGLVALECLVGQFGESRWNLFDQHILRTMAPTNKCTGS